MLFAVSGQQQQSSAGLPVRSRPANTTLRLSRKTLPAAVYPEILFGSPTHQTLQCFRIATSDLFHTVCSGIISRINDVLG
jgi:hypothetical protein